MVGAYYVGTGRLGLGLRAEAGQKVLEYSLGLSQGLSYFILTAIKAWSGRFPAKLRH